MATDYDAPRRSEDDAATEPVEALGTHRTAAAQPGAIDVDETDTVEGIELPGADLSGEVLDITVVPVQADEFTCASCFLVHHRSQLARESNGSKFCRECEG